ncbi:hypothetical protein [Entomobacter blattae]|nr:hypothetical protein [Entomobacter blattae]
MNDPVLLEKLLERVEREMRVVLVVVLLGIISLRRKAFLVRVRDV